MKVLTEAAFADPDGAVRAHGIDIGHVYNAGDVCSTREVWDVIRARLTPDTDRVYGFEMACQAPVMAMMFRGLRVDHERRDAMVAELESERAQIARGVNEMVTRWWDRTELETGACPTPKRKDGKHSWPRLMTKSAPLEVLPPTTEPISSMRCGSCDAPRQKPSPLNPGSDDQVSELFYVKMGLSKQYNKDHKPSVDEECLNRLGRKYARAAPITSAILAYRGIAKQIGVLNSAVSPDGRMRYSISVGATETGRYSSSKNCYGEGTNIQNIADKLRCIFVADPGWELFYADLEQSESRDVAYLADEAEYIRAHDTGDVHTYVSRLVWPELAWPGTPKGDRDLAESLRPEWDKDHDYRYNAKRTQHGSNYGLSPRGMAIIAHIPIAAAEDAQGRYFKAFAGIRRWHGAIAAELRQSMTLTTPFGRRRQFMGRMWGNGPLQLDDHVFKEGLAFKPQSMTAEKLNIGMWRVWTELEVEAGRVQLLAQIHDAILGQRRIGDDEVLVRVKDLMTFPVEVNGRRMITPVDIKVGNNWGSWHADRNPGGMRKWKSPPAG